MQFMNPTQDTRNANPIRQQKGLNTIIVPFTLRDKLITRISATITLTNQQITSQTRCKKRVNSLRLTITMYLHIE